MRWRGRRGNIHVPHVDKRLTLKCQVEFFSKNKRGKEFVEEIVGNMGRVGS